MHPYLIYKLRGQLARLAEVDDAEALRHIFQKLVTTNQPWDNIHTETIRDWFRRMAHEAPDEIVWDIGHQLGRIAQAALYNVKLECAFSVN